MTKHESTKLINLKFMKTSNISSIITIKDGVLVLPKYIEKRWRQKKVLVTSTSNRIIIQPAEQDWDTYEEKLKKGRKMISSAIIKEATQAAKK